MPKFFPRMSEEKPPIDLDPMFISPKTAPTMPAISNDKPNCNQKYGWMTFRYIDDLVVYITGRQALQIPALNKQLLHQRKKRYLE